MHTSADPAMQQEIEMHISAGRATFNVLLLVCLFGFSSPTFDIQKRGLTILNSFPNIYLILFSTFFQRGIRAML